MLDITTKQKIDSLRNLLVGKVPDPKSQVEQITVALFYKFMWDRDKEITIEVSEKNLEKYNLSFDQITMAINAGSIDLPGGLLSSKSGDLLIRTVGQSYNANEYENIVIKGQPDGSQLLL